MDTITKSESRATLSSHEATGLLFISHRLRMAESRVQGMFVAPSTRTPSLLLPTPAARKKNGEVNTSVGAA
jgi:hypothetical protein